MSEVVVPPPPTTDRTKEVDNSLVFSYLTLRNLIEICGWTMILCIVSLAAYVIFHPVFVKKFPIIFIFETIAIWAFGFSWLTKGETLWPHGEHYMKKAYRNLKTQLTNN
jgi:hypothetical protein